MRTLFVLAAVLSLTSALVTPYNETAASYVNQLKPRMPPGRGSGNRGNGNNGNGRGRQGKEWGSPEPEPYGGTRYPGHGATSQQVRDAIAQEPGYTSGWNPVVPNRPNPGRSGVWVDRQRQRIELHYGDDMPYHADHELYHQQAYPASRGRGYGSSGSSSQSRDQRARALNGLPAGYGPWIVRDENRGASVDWMHNGISRNDAYGYNPLREDTTNMPVPDGESAAQSRMFSEARRLTNANPAYRMYYYDNRLHTANFRVQPNRGPMLPNNNDGRGHPYHTTNENPGYQRKAKRDMTQIADINSQISDQSTTTTDLQQQYELNLLAYQTVSANATDLLFPVIDSLLASSNLTIIHDMAFSLLQIVGSPQSMVGPFMYGMTNFDWFEDQITHNMTDEQKQNDPNVQLMYAQDGLLIELYEQAWENATAAANATGYLSDLEALANHLITNDTSVIPQAATTVVQDQYYEEIDYFYANLIDETSPSANGSIQPYPTDGAPFSTGSGGQWLIGSATGSVAAQSSTGTVPIDNGFLANPTVEGLVLGNLVTNTVLSPSLSTGTALPRAQTG